MPTRKTTTFSRWLQRLRTKGHSTPRPPRRDASDGRSYDDKLADILSELAEESENPDKTGPK